MKLVCFVVACFVAIANCDVFGFGSQFNVPTKLVSINPQNGFNKKVADLSFLTSFTTLLPVTHYDGNSEQYIIGNADPPMLALTNTFSSKTQVVNLPQYGQLLAFTAYDGIIYSLIGNDPDVPFLGHLVAMDISTKDTTRLAKVKIDPSQKFKVGAPMAYMPQNRLWLTEIENSPVLLITVQNNVSTVTPSKISGGWANYWNDVNSNSSVVGYSKGMIAWIDPFAGTVKPMRTFACSGSLAVAFQYKEMYHLSNCNNQLTIETVEFTNVSTATSKLDPSLADLTTIHTAAAYIPYGCGATCGVNTDCQIYKTCSVCRNGKCSADGQCGSFCLSGQDCYAGVCVNNCEFNRCGRRGCGTTCNNHDDCVAVSNQCRTCRLGRCVDTGNCGSYCLTPLDCYAGSCTNKCVNWQCAP